MKKIEPAVGVALAALGPFAGPAEALTHDALRGFFLDDALQPARLPNGGGIWCYVVAVARNAVRSSCLVMAALAGMAVGGGAGQ